MHSAKNAPHSPYVNGSGGSVGGEFGGGGVICEKLDHLGPRERRDTEREACGLVV